MLSDGGLKSVDVQEVRPLVAAMQSMLTLPWQAGPAELHLCSSSSSSSSGSSSALCLTSPAATAVAPCVARVTLQWGAGVEVDGTGTRQSGVQHRLALILGEDALTGVWLICAGSMAGMVSSVHIIATDATVG
jgi:hypothetical protein